MSLTDIFKIKNRSTKRLLGIKNIHENSVELYNGNIIIAFKIRPSNVSTLSQDTLTATINRLFVVIKSLQHIEFCAYDTAASYSANNKYLLAREVEEKDPIIKKMAQDEREHLASIKTNTATGKEFLIQLRFTANNQKQIASLTRHAEKILLDNCLFPVLQGKEQLKYSLSIYYQKK